MSLPRLALRLRPLLPLLEPTTRTTSTPSLRLRLRAFTTTPPPAYALPSQLPPRLVIPDSDLEENFLKGSGPGGQKINKTSSAVQLKHLPTGIVVKCQETRSRSQNRKLARKILGERIEELELGEGARTRVKAAEERRKKASRGKKSRRKYRALEKGSGEGEGEGEERIAEGEGMREGGNVREEERVKVGSGV